PGGLRRAGRRLRAARGQRRTPQRWPGSDRERPRGQRNGGRRGRLPARLGIPPARRLRPVQASGRRRALIRRVIAFSAARPWLILAVTASLCAIAVYCARESRLDALPDLSDTQVIVYTQWDRAAGLVEDQITYPIVAALLGSPRARAVRGYSDFG